jgi:hypothetical protein
MPVRRCRAIPNCVQAMTSAFVARVLAGNEPAMITQSTRRLYLQHPLKSGLAKSQKLICHCPINP